MSLEQTYIATLDKVTKNSGHTSDWFPLAMSLIDLTLLDESASREALSLLFEKAYSYRVAAICVFPDVLPKAERSNNFKRATVVNFPQGQDPLAKTLENINNIISCHNPDEIDYVFPWQKYLDGFEKTALTHCQQAYALCKKNNILFKVILETGAWPCLQTMYQVSRELIDMGCDFLKTSTGKFSIGATPIAAFTILQAIKDSGLSSGLKVSGGIREPEQAFLYMNLANEILEKQLDKSWFRIGASSLLDSLAGAHV